VAAEAAQNQLAQGGSAVSAVLAGFFAAAGAYAGVLLGPVSLLVGGVGVGARAFDGRLCQPGLGAKRPRGVAVSDAVPEAARVAVPTALTALAVALSNDGSKSLGALVKPGISKAERSGADARASVLKLVRGAGAGAFHDSSFVRALLRVAGPSQGGLLGPGDFSAVPEVDADAKAKRISDRNIFEAPWAADAESMDPAPLGVGFAVCAVDVRRVFAALCYRRTTDGFLVDELELEAPLAAIPVRKGVPRVQPGERLPAPAPMALLLDASGACTEIIATPGALSLGAAELAAPRLHLRAHLGTGVVDVLAGD
jgi:gamma-glutamyltranspeptidase/glutathione hydrolase